MINEKFKLYSHFRRGLTFFRYTITSTSTKDCHVLFYCLLLLYFFLIIIFGYYIDSFILFSIYWYIYLFGVFFFVQVVAAIYIFFVVVVETFIVWNIYNIETRLLLPPPIDSQKKTHTAEPSRITFIVSCLLVSIWDVCFSKQSN